MLRELEGLVTTPATEEEIQRAASYVAGQTEVGRQRGAAVMAEILDAWLEGTGLAELEDPTGPYLAVTAEQVRSIAARYLDPARRAEGVVRGKIPD
jgi:predicted Zn-dependent peptidase